MPARLLVPLCLALAGCPGPTGAPDARAPTDGGTLDAGGGMDAPGVDGSTADPDAPGTDAPASTDDAPSSADAPSALPDAPVALDAPLGTDAPVPATDAGIVPTSGRYFPDGAWFYQRIDGARATVRADSRTTTSWLEANGGWGSGTMRIDFSIEVLDATAATPYRTFVETGDFYSPDCDSVMMPVPAGGALEGETGYACVSDGDCHLIVVDRRVNRLYEMWRANIVGATFYGGCLAAWDMTRVYGPTGRGEQCTSADAAGFPIAPLLFTADEVAAGRIDHAIRFILPNARMADGVYVHPGTHGTGATSGPATAPVYGSRWRLRADFPLASLPNDGARVVARAMQEYGIALADGGTIALTARSDRSTTASWAGLLDSYDLGSIRPNDFEVVDTGAPITLTYDCVRTPY